MKYKVLDLFCGIGGFSLGFEMTNKFEVVLAADIWDVAISTFTFNHPDVNFINSDITLVEDSFWKKYKGLDIIIAGPPCQGFSMSGKRIEGDKRNTLFEEVIRITKITQPKFTIIENVVGLLSMKDSDGKLIKDVIFEKFNEIGYDVKYEILNASEFGVPQARKRVIFIASRKFNILFPKKTHGESEELSNFVTVGDALSNIPESGEIYLPVKNNYQKMLYRNIKIANHEPIKHAPLIVERMSFIPHGGNWQDIPLHLGQGGGKHSNNYKRLDPSIPSITIKHATKSMIVHPFYNRTPTVREIARLQSFPDDFILYGSKSDQHQQLANAVPPLLGFAIANNILEKSFK